MLLALTTTILAVAGRPAVGASPPMKALTYASANINRVYQQPTSAMASDFSVGSAHDDEDSIFSGHLDANAMTTWLTMWRTAQSPEDRMRLRHYASLDAWRHSDSELAPQ